MSARLYVGNLPMDIKESEVDDLFYKYGKIRFIDIKAPARPPAFAFITFEDSRDAEDAVRGRDGYEYDGRRLRVEFSKGERRGRDEPRRDDRREERRRGAAGRRSDFAVKVTGLPRNCSWQDLKDFMRKAGDVIHTDVYKNGDGLVEFSNREDMENAIRKLDDTEFQKHGDSTYIRIKPLNKSGGSEERDRSRSRDRDRSRSRDRRRSPSRSRSRSPDNRRRSPSPTRDDKEDGRNHDN